MLVLFLAASLTSQPEPLTVIAASSTTSEQKEQQIVSEQVATDVLNQAIPVAASQLQSPVSNQPQPQPQLPPNLPSVAVAVAAAASASSAAASAPQPPPPTQSQVPSIPVTSLTDPQPQTEPSLPFMKPLELRSRSNSVTNAVAEIERQVTQVTPLPTGGKVAPPTLPKPTSNSTPTPWSSTGPATTFPSAPTSSSTSVPLVPAPGRSTIAGSKQAPRRGRGQLKPPGTPGTRVPICAVCQVPIRGPFIVALGKTWCRDHFNCANNQCRRSLQEIGFVEEQGLLYCESCFEAYLPICAKCNVPIKGVSFYCHNFTRLNSITLALSSSSSLVFTSMANGPLTDSCICLFLFSPSPGVSHCNRQKLAPQLLCLLLL